MGAIHLLPQAEETLGQAVRRLQAEARAMALDHVDHLVDRLQLAELAAREIGEGGEPYPAGIRDRALRLAETLRDGRQTIVALLERAQ